MNSITRRSATALISVAAVLAPFSRVAAQTQLPNGAPDVLTLLQTEHRAALGLIDQILATSDGEQRGRLLRKLADALTIHNANEENIVYPAIREAAHKADDAMTLYHQQDDAKVLIAGLMLAPKDDAAFTEGVKKLQAALMAHIHQEETVDFPAVRTALGPKLAELNAMTAPTACALDHQSDRLNVSTDEDHTSQPSVAPGGPLATPATPEGRDAAEDEGEEA